MVRVSPDELSFSSVTSWKSIYGHQSTGRFIMTKSDFHRMSGAGFNTLCIGSERGPRKYSKIKKKLFNVFSTKALVEQEQLVRELIDAFIDRIGKDGGPATKGPNITK